MLANQVNASRRSINVTRFTIKVLDETASYKINFHHIYNRWDGLLNNAKAIDGLLFVLLARIQNH